MHFNKFAVTAASAALFAVVRADDLNLDNDDIPQQCRDVCAPVRTLADICEVDDDDRMTDREEDLLQAQCFCLNSSFDVASRTSACAACMHENNRDRDDNDDIDEIMRTCGFSSTSYSAGAQATSISVQATRPVSAAQLTTTISGAAANTGTGTQPTSSSGSNSNNDNNNNNGNSNNNDDNSNSTPSETPNAAPGTAPAGLGSIFGVGAYVAAAAVAGAMLLQ